MLMALFSFVFVVFFCCFLLFFAKAVLLYLCIMSMLDTVYSGKLSWEKTLANFVVLLQFVKVFSTKMICR